MSNLFSKIMRGQASLELLAIVGVLIIGGVIVSVFVIGNINKGTKQASSIGNGLLDDLNRYMVGDEPNYGNYGGSGGGSTGAVCGNGICESGENQSNCPEDCGGEWGLDINATSPTPPVYINTNFTTSLSKNISETIDVNIDIGRKNIYGDYVATTNCSYNGVYSSSFPNITQTSSTSNYIFNCNTDGNYQITYSAHQDGNTSNSASDQIIVSVTNYTPPSNYMLSTDNNIPYVGDSFIVTLSSPSLDVNATTPVAFTYDSNVNSNTPIRCEVSTSNPTCNIVSGSSYCGYTSTCTRPNYSQTGTHSLLPYKITASFSGHTATTEIYPGYDLSLPGCETITNEYGTATICMTTSTYGTSCNYNSDYWDDNGYGFMKACVNIAPFPDNCITNEYGTMCVHGVVSH